MKKPTKTNTKKEKTSKLDGIKAMALIKEALNEPGKRQAAYSAFHNFSLRNQMLAAWQLEAKGLDIAPIKTFKQWGDYGRTVKKGEKAIALLMPLIVNIKETDEETGEEKVKGQRKIFVEKNYWFALSQTKEFKDDNKKTLKRLENDVPERSSKQALKNLKLKRIKFTIVNGNAQGYTNSNGIAINPLAVAPVKTMIHEIAHNLLGHLKNAIKASLDFDLKSIQEAEAETTAYLVCASLGLDGLEYCRNYIQNWLNGREFSEESAKKCIEAANKILEAGKTEKAA